MRYCFISIFLLGFHFAIGQKWQNLSEKINNASGTLSLTSGGGLSYYMGDLRSQMNLRFVDPQVSIGINYRITEWFSARGEFNYYGLSGSQSGGPSWFNNLSFRSSNPAMSISTQVDAVKFSSKKSLRPYFLGGIGFTYITPKALYEGNWYSLAPLMTENVSYSRTVSFFLAGIGIVWKYNSRWAFGLELLDHFARSDYLDDVSTVYPSPVGMSELGLKLSDRRPEIDPNLLPPSFPRSNEPGFKRGNSQIKDSFGFLTLRAEYILSTRYYRAEKRKLKCFIP